MATEGTAIRKQTQINKAGRTMFIWIAIASVLVGVALVVSYFLLQKIIYTEKVLGEKQNTASTLTHNLDAIDDLKANVRALDANSALLSVRANPSDQALQVVLDALPSEANSLALGASLQTRLLANVTGDYTLETLQVSPVQGVESAIDDTVVDASATIGVQPTIGFSFSIAGDQVALKEVLQNLERSVRTIQVNNMNLETQGGRLSLSVEGTAFYQPSKTIQLTDLTVKAN